MVAAEAKPPLQVDDIMSYDSEAGTIEFARGGDKLFSRTEGDAKYYIGPLSEWAVEIVAEMFGQMCGLKPVREPHHHPSNIYFRFVQLVRK